MKKNNKTLYSLILLTIAILFMFCTLQIGFAADVPIDNTTTGGINGAITDAGTNPGDTILLNSGNYTGSNNTGITIDKNLTIKGNGPTDSVIIDAQGQSRIFTIGANNLNVTFINITFINGNTIDYGGAIYNQYANTMMTFINCTFINNNVILAFAAHGGAICNWGVNFTVINSTFINNNATNGGAIYNLGANSTVSNSTFTGNTATNGAVIANIGGFNFNVRNSTFINNKVTNVGGAIYNGAGATNFTVDNSTFTGNNANFGGAIYNGGSSNNFTVNNSIFTSNKANDGGAIFNDNTANFTVSNSTFINNEATRGGGINNNIFGSILVSNNVMNGNTANWCNAILNRGVMGILNLTYLSNSTLVTKIGSITTLYASLTDDMGNTVTGQNISFYLNGVLYENVDVIEGLAEINFTATPLGDIPVSGEYDGNGDFAILINDGLLRIIKIDVSTTIVVPENVTVGKEINITGVLTDEDGNPVGNVTLNVTVGNKTFTVTTNPDGSWTLPYTPDTAGNLDVTVSLTDNDIYNDFSNSTNLIVNKIRVGSTIVVPEKVTVGKEINITGVATDEDGNPLANTVLTVTIDGKTYTVTTDSNGGWTHTYMPTHTGNIEASISWAGNDTHNGFTNNANFNVAKRNIIVTITATENPDGSVTVIANATYEDDGSPATGYPVDFLLDGKIIGTGVTDSNGIATLTIPANKISDGPHTISVVGIGDDTTNDTTASIEFTKTSKDNSTNKTSDKPTTTTAAMKNTGIPIISIILLLLTSIGLIVVKRKN